EMAVFYDLFDFRERIFILCVLPREELDSFGDRQNRIVAVVAVHAWIAVCSPLGWVSKNDAERELTFGPVVSK
mgnify:CR=1